MPQQTTNAVPKMNSDLTTRSIPPRSSTRTRTGTTIVAPSVTYMSTNHGMALRRRPPGRGGRAALARTQLSSVVRAASSDSPPRGAEQSYGRYTARRGRPLLGDAGDPQLVRRGPGEAALHQFGRDQIRPRASSGGRSRRSGGDAGRRALPRPADTC